LSFPFRHGLDAPPPPPPPDPPASSRTPLIVIVSTVVVVAAMMAFVFTRSSGNGEQNASTTIVSTTTGDVATLPNPIVTLPPVTTQPESTDTSIATVVTPPQPTGLIGNVFATSARADSTDACGNSTSYAPLNAVDGRRDTAWMTPGDGSGQSITVEFTEPTYITSVGLVPGYDKFDPCSNVDRFYEFRRIVTVRWQFDEQAPTIQYLDSMSPEMQFIATGGITAWRVTMTILSTTAPGLDRLDHTPVSDLEIS
jgi:hypothetical protein